MWNTLRARITLPYLALSIVGLAVVAISVSALLRNTFYAIYQQKLLDECSLLAELFSPLMAEGSVDASASPLNFAVAHYAEQLEARVTVVDMQGDVIGESDADKNDMSNHLHRPEIIAAIETGEGTNIRYSDTLDQQVIYSARRVDVDGNPVGVVRLSIPVETFQQSLRQVNRLITWFSIALAAVSAGVAALISNRLTKPIQEIQEKIEAIGNGHFGHQIIHTRTPELLSMNRALNRMGEQLSSQLDTITSEKNRLSVVLEQMADGALFTDHLGIVEYINPAALQILNIEPEATIGYTFAEAARHHQIIELWRKCLESGEQQGALIEPSGENGRFLQVIITPLQGSQQPGYLLILQDLTALRRLETTRSDFISNISHDLRTPISSLRLMTETLQNGAVNDPAVSSRFLSLMEESIETMSQLVEELLELSRTQSGRVPLQLKPLPIGSIIEPAVERLRPQAERGRLNLRFELPPNLPLVMADHERVSSVVTNLLHNAIKFSLPGGDICISARREKNEMLITVQDTGIGIAAQDVENIFERFYKVDRARAAKGMGLGLSIAKTVVEGHGGRIWVESTPDQGSTFYFTLPIVKSGTTISNQEP